MIVMMMFGVRPQFLSAGIVVKTVFVFRRPTTKHGAFFLSLLLKKPQEFAMGNEQPAMRSSSSNPNRLYFAIQDPFPNGIRRSFNVLGDLNNAVKFLAAMRGMGFDSL